MGSLPHSPPSVRRRTSPAGATARSCGGSSRWLTSCKTCSARPVRSHLHCCQHLLPGASVQRRAPAVSSIISIIFIISSIAAVSSESGQTQLADTLAFARGCLERCALVSPAACSAAYLRQVRAAAHYASGLAHLRTGPHPLHPDAATSELRAAAELLPSDNTLCVGAPLAVRHDCSCILPVLAQAHLSSRRFDAALSAIEECLALDSLLSAFLRQCLMIKGQILHVQGDAPAAVAVLHTALAQAEAAAADAPGGKLEMIPPSKILLQLSLFHESAYLQDTSLSAEAESAAYCRRRIFELEGREAPDVCGICLDTLSPCKPTIRAAASPTLLACFHSFHKNCFRDWERSQGKAVPCPVCSRDQNSMSMRRAGVQGEAPRPELREQSPARSSQPLPALRLSCVRSEPTALVPFMGVQKTLASGEDGEGPLVWLGLAGTAGGGAMVGLAGVGREGLNTVSLRALSISLDGRPLSHADVACAEQVPGSPALALSSAVRVAGRWLIFESKGRVFSVEGLATLGAARPAVALRRVACAAAAPPPRSTGCVAEHAGELYLLGGRCMANQGRYEAGGFAGMKALWDMWAFSPAAGAWREVPLSGAHPAGSAPGLRGTSAVSLPGGRLLLFGGVSNLGYSRDVYEVDLASGAVRCLAPQKGPEPSARSNAAAVLLPDGRHVVMYGGATGEACSSDCWLWDTVEWSWARVECTGLTPLGGRPEQAIPQSACLAVLPATGHGGVATLLSYGGSVYSTAHYGAGSGAVQGSLQQISSDLLKTLRLSSFAPPAPLD